MSLRRGNWDSRYTDIEFRVQPGLRRRYATKPAVAASKNPALKHRAKVNRRYASATSRTDRHHLVDQTSTDTSAKLITDRHHHAGREGRADLGPRRGFSEISATDPASTLAATCHPPAAECHSRAALTHDAMRAVAHVCR